jgi:hypothetical protein
MPRLPACLHCSSQGSQSGSPSSLQLRSMDPASVAGSRANSPDDAKILAHLERELQGIAASAAREQEEERQDQAPAAATSGRRRGSGSSRRDSGSGGRGSGGGGPAMPPEPAASVTATAGSGWADHAWEGGWAAEGEAEEAVLQAASPSMLSDATPGSSVLAPSPSPEASPAPKPLLENGVASAAGGAGTPARQNSRAAAEAAVAAAAVAAAEAAAAEAEAAKVDLQRKLSHWKAQVRGCMGHCLQNDKGRRCLRCAPTLLSVPAFPSCSLHSGLKGLPSMASMLRCQPAALPAHHLLGRSRGRHPPGLRWSMQGTVPYCDWTWSV